MGQFLVYQQQNLLFFFNQKWQENKNKIKQLVLTKNKKQLCYL